MPRYNYTHRQQLISTQTIADIAKQVHEAETPKLIHRLYLFGRYDPDDNLWTALPAGGEPALVDWYDNSKIVDICRIMKMDIATRPRAGPADNPQTARNEAQQAGFDNPNLLSSQFTDNGKRRGNAIKIYALSALVRLSVFTNIPQHYTDKVTFRMGFYKYTSITANGILDNADTPDIKTLVKWKPFGYSAQLDNLDAAAAAGQNQGMPFASENLEMLLTSAKVQKLAEREISINISSTDGITNVRTVRMFRDLDIDPLQFAPDDINGIDTTNFKIFFAIRSDLPNALTGFTLPECMACVKVHYTNVV